MVGVTRSTIRVKHPAASIRRAFRDAASVSIHASPPGSYWYQIGTVSGPRSGPADTDKAAICGSARNSSRSRTDNLLSAMAPSMAQPPASSPGSQEALATIRSIASPGKIAPRRTLTV